MTTWMTLCKCASVKWSGTRTRRQTGGLKPRRLIRNWRTDRRLRIEGHEHIVGNSLCSCVKTDLSPRFGAVSIWHRHSGARKDRVAHKRSPCRSGVVILQCLRGEQSSALSAWRRVTEKPPAAELPSCYYSRS